MIADGGEIIIEKKPIFIGKPLVVILVIASVFVLALGIGISITAFSPRKVDQVVSINPDQNQVVNPVVKPASKFAGDPAFILLKSELDGFSSELSRIDLSEPQLAPPNIDLNISVGSF